MTILKIAFIVLAFITAMEFTFSIYHYGKIPMRKVIIDFIKLLAVIFVAYGIGQVI